MITITRAFGFDAGHRILGHEGKCANLHGHRYSAEVTVTAAKLDNLDRVLDFSEVKRVIGEFIEDNWDHNMILHKDDPLLRLRSVDFGPKDPYILDNNPTAEVLAETLLHIADSMLITEKIPARVTHVRMYETPNCWADATHNH